MRWRAEQARQALAEGQAAAAAEAARFRADRDLAAATWDTRLRDRSWFTDAPVEEILRTWASAEAWAQTGDARAVAACERLRLEVRHLGVDPDIAQHAVTARDVQALADLIGGPEPGQASTSDAPITFPITTYDHESMQHRTLSKAEALAVIEGATGPEPGDPDDDIDRWFGRDPDVDAALSRKWPERYPAASVTDSKPAVGDDDAKLGQAPQPGRRRQAAGRGLNEVAGDELQKMTDLVASSMQPTEATAILADPNWPRVAGQLSRAKSKIDAFNVANASNPQAAIDLPKVLSDLQFNRPSEELRTPAGWLIWQLHNQVAASGVRLSAQAHPDGHQARTRRDGGTRPTRGHGHPTRGTTPRRDTERGGS